MASVIDICNLALSHIGKFPINSLEDKTKEAQECRLLYPRARESTLRDHDWNFATKRLTMALIDQEYPGWKYVYQYPTDCIRAMKIYNPASRVDEIEYEIGVNNTLSGRVILTDYPNAVLIYVASVTDPNVFDAMFTDALSYRLAADLALPLRGEAQIQSSMVQNYMMIMGRTRAQNSNEKFHEPTDDSSFLGARA